MAIPVYMWLKDDGGADIKGSVDVQNREGSIEITALGHDITLPADNATGKKNGIRIHAPYIINKEVDPSSPYLYQALTMGKTLNSAELKYYRANDKGQEE